MARVLVVANSTWNLQNFRAGLVRELLRAGHEVITCSPDPNGLKIEGKQPRHRFFRMDRSGTDPRKDIASFFQMLRIVSDERPDVFLGFTIKPNIYGCIACRMRNVAAIPNVSGLGTAFLGGSAFRRTILLFYRFAFARAKVVFFQNPEDAGLFVAECAVSPAQARVLPGSGISLSEFSPTEVPRELTFLMIARLLGDKGVREYVTAAKEVKAKYPHATFSLLGDLDRQNRSAIREEELERWMRESAVEYLGVTSDVRPFIRKAAAVVLPSYREGLPRTLLEAAAMGRPLIGTDVPGCRQVIRDGVTGFLCEARSDSSLALAMERFVRATYETREQMGWNARRMVEEEFDERQVVNAYLEEISRAVSSTAGPEPLESNSSNEIT